MESAETFIVSQLDAQRSRLVQAEEELQRLSDAARHLQEGAHGTSSDATWTVQTEITSLQGQVRLLEQLKERLDRQNIEAPARFDPMTTSDASLSKRALWLVIISSTVSFILGWLLSLLSSPEAFMHVFSQ